MHHNSQVYRLIADLLAAWEKEGFTLGIETHLQLRELTQKLPEDTDIKQLKTILAPLFVNTRDEQESFYEVFDTISASNSHFFTETTSPSVSGQNINSATTLKTLWHRFWEEWRDEFLVGLAILAAIWLLKNVLTPKPQVPQSDVYIPILVNLDQKEQRMCIDSTNFVEDAVRFVQKMTISDSNFFYSVRSIDKITPDSSIKHVQLRTFLQEGKACIFYKGIAAGQDTIHYKICLSSQDSCTIAHYIFNVVDDNDKGRLPSPTLTLESKPFNHAPDISTLLPTETWRLGWKYGYWDWLKTFIFLALIVLILALGKWLNRRKQLIFKDLKGNSKAPYSWGIQFDNGDKIIFNDIFYSVSNQLRKRSENEIIRFDVPKTVNATIKQGGRVSFQYRKQTQSNEYLLLIDMPSAANHQAQLFNFLSTALAENEVLIERFFYNGDVRLCWNEKYKRGITLKELQHLYAEHRLIIIGSGHSFLSTLNGRLAKWTTIFDHWRIKALFSTRPATEWDMREAQLAQKFRLLPASQRGFGDVVETLEAIEPKDYRLWKTVKEPLSQPLRLPETLTEEELISILTAEYRRYHNKQPDDRLVLWIAACAVYPTLHWDLTLALAPPLPSTHEEIPPLGRGGAVVSLDNLFALIRLSWFVEGKIPESARKILLKWLADKHPSVLDYTRRQLSDILKSCQPPTDSVAFEDYRLQMVMNELYLKPNKSERKALEAELEKLLALDAEQDFLVAEYLNRPQTSLDFIVPENLRKFVRIEQSNRLPRVPQWLWQVPILLVSVWLIFSFNPKTKECDGESAFYKDTYYCLKSPQDSLVFYEQMLCDTIEFAADVRLIETYDKLIKTYRDSAESLEQRGFPKNYTEQLIIGYEGQKDSLRQYFMQNNLSQNASLEDYFFSQLFKIIRKYNLDSTSLYKNVPIAYWNAAVKHYNKGSVDSACFYFNKLDRWSWRDSVLTTEEVALIGKICYADIQTSVPQRPQPQVISDNDFELFQSRRQFGYRNSRTKAVIIPPQYQSALPFSEGLAGVRKGGLWGFIDYFGNEVIPPQYDNILQGFKGGKSKVQMGKEQFFVDKKGRRIPELVLPQQPPVNLQQSQSPPDTSMNLKKSLF